MNKIPVPLILLTAALVLAEPSAGGSGTWTETGSLNTARSSHTATLLPNGQLLVTGGYHSGPILASAELYNPATGLWTTTGSMVTARGAHTAALLPNGKVLVVGGFDGTSALASAELYDPATGLWTITAHSRLTAEL